MVPSITKLHRRQFLRLAAGAAALPAAQEVLPDVPTVGNSCRASKRVSFWVSAPRKAREGIVDGRDLGMREIGVVPVEEDAFLHHRPLF